jgi:hypothetical protein
MNLGQHLGQLVEQRGLNADGESGGAQSFGQRPGAGGVRAAVSVP